MWGWVDYIRISVFAFALSALWNSMNLIVMPARVMDFAPATAKNTYLGALTSAGLLVAIIVQPIAGAASDASRWSLGRRRPFVLVGAATAAVFLLALGAAPGLLVLWLVYVGLQVATNVAQGPYQGLIPDLVGGEKRGRASAAKLAAEVAGVVALAPATAYFVDRYREGGDAFWLWLALGCLATLLVVAAVLTLALVKERPMVAGTTAPIGEAIRRAFAVGWRERAELRWYLISRFFVLVAMSSVQAFAYYYLTDVVGVVGPAKVAGYLTVVGGAMVLLLAYPAGRLGDRLGRKPMLYVSGVVGCLGVLGLLLAQGVLWVLVSGALLGVATCLFLVNSWALATDLVPRERAAHYLGLVNLAALGGVVARLWGPVIDFFNARQPGLGYTVLFLGCLANIAIGTALVGLVRGPTLREGAP